MVVIIAPVGQEAPGVGEPQEPVLIQALVPQLPVEAFDVAVLRRLARLDEVQLDAVLVGPLIQRPADELGAIVESMRACLVPAPADPPPAPRVCLAARCRARLPGIADCNRQPPSTCASPSRPPACREQNPSTSVGWAPSAAPAAAAPAPGTVFACADAAPGPPADTGAARACDSPSIPRGATAGAVVHTRTAAAPRPAPAVAPSALAPPRPWPGSDDSIDGPGSPGRPSAHSTPTARRAASRPPAEHRASEFF